MDDLRYDNRVPGRTETIRRSIDELQQLAPLNCGDSTGQAHSPKAFWSAALIPLCSAAGSFNLKKVRKEADDS